MSGQHCNATQSQGTNYQTVTVPGPAVQSDYTVTVLSPIVESYNCVMVPGLIDADGTLCHGTK